jgi:bbp48|nr:MAG TPA: nucelotide kinase [Crassvirales sp.]
MEKAEYQGEAHYKGYQYEPVKFIIDMKFDFIQGNILKYLVRYRKKNGLQDLKKARNYAEFSHSYPTRVTSYGVVLEEMDNLRMVCDFVSQKEFDEKTQDFLMIVITLICNYQMKELAHLIDMQMAIEYPKNQHGAE